MIYLTQRRREAESAENVKRKVVEQYALSHDMRSGDAIIAATAIDQSQTLCTSNDRHYRQIPLLELQVLNP